MGRSIEVLDGIDAAQSETTRARPHEIARRGFDGSFEQRGEDDAHGQHDGDSPYGHRHVESPSLSRSGDPGYVRVRRKSEISQTELCII
jgi:hypothetical protein